VNEQGTVKGGEAEQWHMGSTIDAFLELMASRRLVVLRNAVEVNKIALTVVTGTPMPNWLPGCS
jgi:hypothetical protein